MATPNYDIDYNDKRLTGVKADEKAAINEVDKTYGEMISSSDKYYQSQIDAAKDYATTQKQNQQEQTDFAIEQIEQQKGQAKSDYLKEQSGAYVDWQKQSNQYGANAEQMAASGLAKTGYSESSQVSMYNTYQNRVATARESYTRAVLNYDNAIKDARLQNNAALAEIAYNALQAQLELSLQGFQYKNQLVTEMANRKLAVQQLYHTKWTDALNQINTENALAEQVRQHNESLAEEKRQADLANKRHMEEIAIKQAAQRLDEQKFALEKEKYAKASIKGSGSSDSEGSSSSSESSSSKVSSTQKAAKAKGDDTYNKAANEMKKSGAISAGDGGLMTKTEWKRRKNSGSNRAETSYATYEDYVNSFTAWRKANPEK